MKAADRYPADGLDPQFVKDVHDIQSWPFDYAAKWYANLSDGKPNRRHLRYLYANDRFALLTTLLRRKDADNEWIYDRCREVEHSPDGHLDLWARYHYKSTIITFAGIIQEIIRDPEITIAIFSFTKDIAAAFLAQIKGEIDQNENLRRIYSDIFWDNARKEAPRWSSDGGPRGGIVVKRVSNPKEQTVQAFGLVDGLPTSGHWRLLVFDDIVTDKSVTQTDTDQPKKTWLAWEQAQNLGTTELLRRWVAGTRWSFADAYGTMIDQGSVKVRLHPATHDGTINGRPVFLSVEKWGEIKRDQRLTLAAQQLLNPLAGEENTFYVEWLRSYELRPRYLTVWILVDSAGNKPGQQKSDRTAIMVIGMDPLSNFYLLDGYCHRMKLSERTDKYLELNEKWRNQPGVQTVFTGWERYGAMTDIEHVELEARRRRIDGISIEEVNWVRDGSQAKKARIARLEPDFRNSKFWLPRYVHVNGVGKCTWKVEVTEEVQMLGNEPIIDKNTGKPLVKVTPGSGRIVTLPYRGETRAEKEAKLDGEEYRILEPLRRRDADNNVYDLTRVFWDEFKLHPFGAHEDALDATSRVKDMDPMPPIAVDTHIAAERLEAHPDE